MLFVYGNWPGVSLLETFAAAADYAYTRYGLLPVFLPIEFPRDVEAAERVSRLMKTPNLVCQERYSGEELVGILSSMQLVVGMRLHSLIFATVGTAPVIGISYDVKVESFIRDIGSDACIPLPMLTAEKLIQEIDRIAEMGFPRADAAAERLRHGEEVNLSSCPCAAGRTRMRQVVCLSTSNFYPYPTRKQNVMTRLSDAEILYFDPPVSFLAPLKDKTAKARFSAYKQEGKKAQANLTVYALPPVLPFFNRFRWINRWNQKRLARVIRRRMEAHGFTEPLLWCYSPTACDVVARLPRKGLVYDCVDRHSAYRGQIDPAVVDRQEEDLARQCDVVFCTARGLFETLLRYNQNTYLIPNGAAYELFSQAATGEHPGRPGTPRVLLCRRAAGLYRL